MNYRRIVVLLLFCAALTAQAIPDLWLTGDKLNGHAWQSMSNREHVVYLQGLREAFLVADFTKYGDWFPRGSYEEIAAALDKMYMNPYKGDIPIINSLRIIRDEQADKGKKQ